ncbi:cellulose synthase [Phytoactinopolyspora endophytica]|uniref:cellulose synthase n=1 Tax=Phytoactinopolyspora endophytica TaxID=1642495 RepID=UPI00101BBFFA|nr:cellulose synthase [Phytoactinopolyspora endophytica]
MGTLISILVAVLGTGMVGLAIRELRTKGAAASMQMAAFGLLLVGSSAVGLVRFVTQLVFNPLAWVGVGLLSLAGVLFVVGQKLEGPSDKPKKTKEVDSSKEKPAVEPAPKRKGKDKDKASAGGDDDFDDIEAILRKHGID